MFKKYVHFGLYSSFNKGNALVAEQFLDMRFFIGMLGPYNVLSKIYCNNQNVCFQMIQSNNGIVKWSSCLELCNLISYASLIRDSKIVAVKDGNTCIEGDECFGEEINGILKLPDIDIKLNYCGNIILKVYHTFTEDIGLIIDAFEIDIEVICHSDKLQFKPSSPIFSAHKCMGGSQYDLKKDFYPIQHTHKKFPCNIYLYIYVHTLTHTQHSHIKCVHN